MVNEVYCCKANGKWYVKDEGNVPPMSKMVGFYVIEVQPPRYKIGDVDSENNEVIDIKFEDSVWNYQLQTGNSESNGWVK